MDLIIDKQNFQLCLQKMNEQLKQTCSWEEVINKNIIKTLLDQSWKMAGKLFNTDEEYMNYRKIWKHIIHQGLTMQILIDEEEITKYG